MRTIQVSPLLRRALVVDGVFSGVSGALLTLGADLFSGVTALPHGLLLGAGLFLLPYAAFVGLLGTRESLARALVWFVVAGNALWTLESVLLLVSGQVARNALGVTLVIAQALVVAALAEAQAIGLSRSRPALAA
jgi:hypothetical protein